MAKHNEHGFETPDPTPMTLPIGAEKPLTIEQQMARFLCGEFARQRQEMMPPDPLDNDDEDLEPLTQAELNAVVEDFENERTAKRGRRGDVPGDDETGADHASSGDSDSDSRSPTQKQRAEERTDRSEAEDQPSPGKRRGDVRTPAKNRENGQGRVDETVET